MSIDFVWFVRITQIVAIVILGGAGMCHLLNPGKETPVCDWDGPDGDRNDPWIAGWKAQAFGAFCIVTMFVLLFHTEHTLVKHINPDAWELSTRGEKIEMLHKDIQSLRDSIKETEQ